MWQQTLLEGIYFGYLKNLSVRVRLGLGLGLTLILTLTLKQHSLKKKIDPDPSSCSQPDPVGEVVHRPLISTILAGTQVVLTVCDL